MIKINIKDNQIKVTGHAGYDESGKDIVCASVSSIIITTVNAILNIDSQAIDYKEIDGVLINILKTDKITNILINNMIDLLEQLEHQYPKYIKLRRC